MADRLREQDVESVRLFVDESREFFTGHVLDYGAGKRPYWALVEKAGATYHPYDRMEFPGNTSGENLGWDSDDPQLSRYDAILCTQVIQYFEPQKLQSLFKGFHEVLRPAGYIVMTGPTNWPITEQVDRIRLTRIGARDLLTEVGFTILRMIDRGGFTFEDEEFSIGWGIVARASA